jgi:hypothetical protein
MKWILRFFLSKKVNNPDSKPYLQETEIKLPTIFNIEPEIFNQFVINYYKRAHPKFG